MAREMKRVYDSTDGVIARAGRAHEDPREMTVTAREVRLAKYVAEALKSNPDLEPIQAARAGKLLLRAHMLRLARKSAEARRAAGGSNAGGE